MADDDKSAQTSNDAGGEDDAGWSRLTTVLDERIGHHLTEFEKRQEAARKERAKSRASQSDKTSTDGAQNGNGNDDGHGHAHGSDRPNRRRRLLDIL